MKRIKFLQAVIVLAGLLLSACAPGAAPSADSANVGGSKAVTEVTFTGVIERMDGDQWIVDSQKITVDASVVRDGAFVVGDTVKVEALIAGDGSLVAQRVEMPSASDLAGVDDNESNDNSNDNGNANDTNGNANDDNSNDDNGNADNSNDDNSNAANGNDDNSNDDNGDDNSNSNGDDSNDDNGNDDNSNDDHGGNGNGSDDDNDDDDDDSNGSGGDDND